MSKWRIDKAIANAMRRYRSDNRGTMSVELVLILPVLFWGYVAMMVFYDAYRARMEAQSAALHVADLISRTAVPVTDAYFEGLNDVYDFLTSRNRETRLRISSLMWVVDNGEEDVAISWSYGTRGLPSLVDLSLGSLGGEDDGQDDGTAPSSFGILDNQLPVADLEDRIPTVLPGEALILVEAFTLWRSPVISWFGFDFLNDVRLAPIAVTRPRFSPFIRYDGVDVVYPEIPPDFFPAPGEPPAPEEEDEEPEPDSTSVTIVDTDFTDGDTDGWSESTITTTSTQTFFGPFGRETRQSPVTYQVNLGEQSRSAQIEFDLYIIDSWDGYNRNWTRPEGEFMTIRVNGSSIALESFSVYLPNLQRNERRTVSSRAEGQFTTTMTLIESGTNTWGNAWDDQVWRVTIDVENPAQTFALGFAAHLDEAIDNESFGFKNFRVTAERGEHGPAHFVPFAARRINEDQFTRFTSYTNCPDHRIAAQTLKAFNSDLTEVIRVRRSADGVSDISGCGIPGAGRFNTASPVLILDYDNNTADVNGNRIRIETEDNNNGNSCDATLLIRDPYGEWSFNSEISRGQGNDNYNARIDLGNAPSGQYHIWMGGFNPTTCATDLVIRRY